MNFIFILRLYGIFLDIILYEFCRLNISNGDIYIVLIVDMGVMLFERYFIRVSLQETIVEFVILREILIKFFLKNLFCSMFILDIFMMYIGLNVIFF